MRMKQSRNGQAGWTTMEYIVGAIILIGIVTAAVGAISGAISTQSEKLKGKIEAVN